MFKEIVQVALITLAIISPPAGILIIALDSISKYKCNSFGRVSGHQVMWVFVDTCYVKVNGRYIRYDEYQARAVAKDGLRELAHGHD